MKVITRVLCTQEELQQAFANALPQLLADNEKPAAELGGSQRASERGSEVVSVALLCEDATDRRDLSTTSISQVSPSVKCEVSMTKEEIREVASLLKAELDPEWLTEAQVCKRIQVSDNWVRENRSKLGARLVPGSKKGWRYNRTAVDAVLINPF